MVKVSVIIPVYNVEKYLKECLDSVLNQSLNDIEVICVNDGSTDSSPEILKEYENRDSRLRIITQDNQGAGAGRNNAMENTSGEYVYFMDSDDYLEPDALRKAYGIASDNDADFAMFKIRNFYEETGEMIDDDYYNMPKLKAKVGSDVFDYSDVSKIALKLCVCPPGNLFKREFIKNIRFPENILFEDNVFFTEAIFKAKRIVFLDEFLYNRRKRMDSTTTPVTVRSIDTIEITNMLLDLCREHGHDNHKRELYYRIFNNIYNVFKKAEPDDKEEIFQKIKNDYSKSRERWENDSYFRDKLNPRYKHIYNCALKSPNSRKFESCVDNYNKKSLLNKLKEKLL